MTKNEYIVQCPRCGAEFPEQEKFCPHCDTPNRKMICRSCGVPQDTTDRDSGQSAPAVLMEPRGTEDEAEVILDGPG